MDPLAAVLEDSCDRILREPIHLEPRPEAAQLVSDGDVALGVPQAYRRGDVEGSARAVSSDRESALCSPAVARGALFLRSLPVGEDALEEVAQKQVDADRLARPHEVAAALDHHKVGPRHRGHCGTSRRRDELVAVAMNDKNRALNLAVELGHLRIVWPKRGEIFGRIDRRDQRLRIGLEPVAHRVFDLFGRVRFVSGLSEEEFQKVAVVAEPIVAVLLRPTFMAFEHVIERVRLPLGQAFTVGRHGREEDQALCGLRVLSREQRRGPRFGADPDDDRALGFGRLHDRDRVRHPLPIGIVLWVVRPVRQTVARSIVRHDAEVVRQIGDLQFPDAGVADGPRRKQEHGLRTFAEDLVMDLDTAALGETLALGRARSHEAAFRLGLRLSSSWSQRSIQSSSSRWPVRMPESMRRCMPTLKVATSATTALRGNWSRSRSYSVMARSNASVTTEAHAWSTLATRLRISGSFHPSA